MSYVRWSEESDLYVFEFGRTPDFVTCFGCLFTRDPEDNPLEYKFTELTDMVKHIIRHREAGHVVPAGLEMKIEQRWPF